MCGLCWNVPYSRYSGSTMDSNGQADGANMK